MCISLCLCASKNQSMNRHPLSVSHSFIHSVNLFVQSFGVLYNSEKSAEVKLLTAELGYICTYDECCVRKETSLPPHCVTVDQAERTSAPSPDINKGQTSLKHADHKSLSAAPRSEGYNKKGEFRRPKKTVLNSSTIPGR